MSKELELFGQVLREVRKEKGFTQDELSHNSGVDRSYISELENGLKAPSILTVFSLAKVLGMKPSKLMEKIEQKMKM